MDTWRDALRDDPLPWLLAEETPAVRHLALRQLLDRPADDSEVVHARDVAMRADPIAAILAARHPEGYWVKAGPGYATKYRGTVWQVIFLDQLGAAGDDPRVRAACAYVLAHTQAESGGFAASGGDHPDPPPPSRAIHCLNGNLLRAVLGFGWLDDPRVGRAIDWQARAITGGGHARYYRTGTSGPGFACAANENLPCACGRSRRSEGWHASPRAALAEDRAGARRGRGVPAQPRSRRRRLPRRLGQRPTERLVVQARLPLRLRRRSPPESGVLCELGFAGDPRLRPAIGWLVAKQDERGRWENQYAYQGKTWVDFERRGRPSKWVTLRTCRVLKAVAAAEEECR